MTFFLDWEDVGGGAGLLEFFILGWHCILPVDTTIQITSANE